MQEINAKRMSKKELLECLDRRENKKHLKKARYQNNGRTFCRNLNKSRRQHMKRDDEESNIFKTTIGNIQKNKRKVKKENKSPGPK